MLHYAVHKYFPFKSLPTRTHGFDVASKYMSRGSLVSSMITLTLYKYIPELKRASNEVLYSFMFLKGFSNVTARRKFFATSNVSWYDWPYNDLSLSSTFFTCRILHDGVLISLSCHWHQYISLRYDYNWWKTSQPSRYGNHGPKQICIHGSYICFYRMSFYKT